jgi:hypothetical protein
VKRAEIAEARLAKLAKQINETHASVLSSVRASLDHAIECGRLLTEARDQVEHGDWLPWIQANFAGSEQSARAYARIFEHRAEISANRQRAGDLSIRGALKLIAAPKKGRRPDPAPSPAVDDDGDEASDLGTPSTRESLDAHDDASGSAKPEAPAPRAPQASADPLKALERKADAALSLSGRLGDVLFDLTQGMPKPTPSWPLLGEVAESINTQLSAACRGYLDAVGAAPGESPEWDVLAEAERLIETLKEMLGRWPSNHAVFATELRNFAKRIERQ